MGEVTDQVTTATIVTTPKSTTPTTFQSISGFALQSVIHNNQNLSYRFPIFETSATALCGTTDNYIHGLYRIESSTTQDSLGFVGYLCFVLVGGPSRDFVYMGMGQNSRGKQIVWSYSVVNCAQARSSGSNVMWIRYFLDEKAWLAPLVLN